MQTKQRGVFLLLLILIPLMPSLVLAGAAQTDQTAQETAAGVQTPASEPTAGFAGTGGQTTDLVVAIFKVMGALALVVGLMVILAFFFKKMGLAGSSFRQGSLISVIDNRMIAPKKYVAVLKIGPEYVVVGITDQNISLLTKLEQNDELTVLVHAAQDHTAMPLASSFAALLQKAAKTMVNKKTDGA